jgi:hypothetical protein
MAPKDDDTMTTCITILTQSHCKQGYVIAL